MKIVLVYPSWSAECGRITSLSRKAGRWPPLNLAYLAAYAEELGHSVAIIDAEAEGMNEEDTLYRCLEYRPDLVGMTATTPFYHLAVSLARKLNLRSPRIPIAIGGPHITVLRERAFAKCFDYGFIGEADHSWPLFLCALEAGRAMTTIPGMLWWTGSQVVSSGAGPACDDMNGVPIPARHLLPTDRYRLGTMHGTKRFTTIMTVRGCPYHCIFCSTDVFGKNTRKRSPDLVIEEMRQCRDRFGISHFMFTDDTLTLDRRHIWAICDKILSTKLGITFEGSTRANLVDEALIAHMRDAGLIRISFGLETVDEDMRQTMRKQVPLEAYLIANRITNSFGIETYNSCMIGLPGETRETVRKTLAFLRRSREIKQANISIAVPYPGTELYEMAKAGTNGLRLETEDFSQYRRYDAAVMTVGQLNPADLREIQNEAYASIYLAPWRWWSMFCKSGWAGVWLTLRRLLRCLRSGKTDYLSNRKLFTTPCE